MLAVAQAELLTRRKEAKQTQLVVLAAAAILQLALQLTALTVQPTQAVVAVDVGEQVVNHLTVVMAVRALSSLDTQSNFL
jgi:hypothetical protein